VVWNFGMVSPNLLPNLLWLPVMGFAVLPLGLAGMLLASLPYGEPAGALLLHAASGLNSTVIGMLGKVGSLGLLFEGVALRPDWTGILGYYLLLGGAAYALGKGLGSRKGRVAGAAFLGAALVLAQPLARELPVKARALSLLLLDTGQSQSILIESPRGKRVLVDGGGTWSTSFDIGRAVTSPVVTWKHPPKLDLMVMSHPDYDHSRGLVFPLRHFQVAAFAGNGRWPGGGSGAALREALAASRAEVQVWKAGMTRELEAGLHIETLHPPAGYNPDEDNDASLVLRLVWRGRGMALIPGDVEAPGLERLLASERELSARLLVLPHHGSSGSLSGEFYDRVAPRTAAACAGYMNYLGFPQPEVRRELARRSVPLHVTGERGALGFTWSSPDSFAVIESRLP
jgi:competence protein ComEC